MRGSFEQFFAALAGWLYVNAGLLIHPNAG
jgi:hypothetical protein